MEEGNFLVERLVIVGLGLIGGSIALSAKERNFAKRTIGVVRRKEAVEEAVRGVVDEATLDLKEAAKEADLLILCTPVRMIIEQLPLVAEVAPERCVVTDVGSTKGAIMEAARKAFEGRVASFVGGHPMAGGERGGLPAARANLFEGAPYALIPGPNTGEREKRFTEQFVKGLGAEPVWMESSEEHDRVVAVTSHLPHATACSLALACFEALPGLQWPRLIGKGFLDTTRVASSPASIWLDIFKTNTSHILPLLRLLRRKIGEFERAVATGDEATLKGLFERAREARNRMAEEAGKK